MHDQAGGRPPWVCGAALQVSTQHDAPARPVVQVRVRRLHRYVLAPATTGYTRHGSCGRDEGWLRKHPDIQTRVSHTRPSVYRLKILRQPSMQAVGGRKALAPRNRNTERHVAKSVVKPRRVWLENDPPVRPPAPPHETRLLLPTAATAAAAPTAEQVAASIADALTPSPQPQGEACAVCSLRSGSCVSASLLCPTLSH
jgi:hypothetical protein